ncbi:hypothetical protein [Candidatus Pelagibacter communis]|uniref:hypothetical protein n=1 Tax=Pelagibacter ubique TaxID=198252 RepID=UPI00094BF139|nr:hypothetical protein [Candidatus Pelagibacter ubique]
MNISTKSVLLISALTSSFFLIYSSYKGTILYFVNEALEDTFVGGSTSDISIYLWFTISGILILITLMFLFFLKIKDLKSQKIIVACLTVFWITISIFLILINLSNFWISLITLTVGVLSFLATKNLKKIIIAELNKKGLTDKEIHLLQKLAGISKD